MRTLNADAHPLMSRMQAPDPKLAPPLRSKLTAFKSCMPFPAFFKTSSGGRNWGVAVLPVADIADKRDRTLGGRIVFPPFFNRLSYARTAQQTYAVRIGPSLSARDRSAFQCALVRPWRRQPCSLASASAQEYTLEASCGPSSTWGQSWGSLGYLTSSFDGQRQSV